jgi:hypothetical protein
MYLFTKKINMETRILEDFIEELKLIEPLNKCNLYVPNLLQSQIFIVNEIIKMAEDKVNIEKLKNNLIKNQ